MGIFFFSTRSDGNFFFFFSTRSDGNGKRSRVGSDDSSIARRVGSWAVETEQRKLIGPINIGFTLLKTNNWFYFLKPNKCFLLGI
jgi:hypothetical protein